MMIPTSGFVFDDIGGEHYPRSKQKAIRQRVLTPAGGANLHPNRTEPKFVFPKTNPAFSLPFLPQPFSSLLRPTAVLLLFPNNPAQ